MSRFLRFLDVLFAPGIVRSDGGAPIHVSANGTTTASTAALDKIIHERFQAMRAAPNPVPRDEATPR
jgi:hypothetical protein